MARVRLIHPGAPQDEDIATMSMAARLAWAYLPCHADSEGRLKDSAFALKALIFPADPVDVDAVLSELAAKNHIVRYEVDGRRYIQIRNFTKYQNPHKNEKKSVLPPAPDSLAVANAGLVYFIENTRSGHIKIGRCDRDVKTRLSSLQTGSVDKLRLLATVEGAYREREFHALFASDRHAGEWFAPSERLMALIALHAESSESSGCAREMSGTARAVSDPDPVIVPERESQEAPSPSLAESEIWSADWWFVKFKTAWEAKGIAGTTAFYGMTGDGDAKSKLSRELANLPREEKLKAQAAAPLMFAAFFATGGESIRTRKWPFSFFVQAFGELRLGASKARGAVSPPTPDRGPVIPVAMRQKAPPPTPPGGPHADP